jgi:two-component system sensor histidine kinase BaeS
MGRIGCFFVVANVVISSVIGLLAWLIGSVLGATDSPVVAVLLGLLALLVLARIARAFRLATSPVGDLIEASGRVEAGDFSTRVPETGLREVRTLARAFNAMSARLEEAEQERRSALADVSHELRTPLAVLKGELEALEDGVRTVSPETIRSLQAEVARLGKLVNDIHDLSLADVGGLAYHFKPFDLGEALRDALRLAGTRFAAAGLALDPAIPAHPFFVRGDAERLAQLFANLVENSLRYTDAGGRVRVALRREENHAVIDWEDSKPGVPEAALPRLFERLFRVEGSRSRERGGSGLGLAICRSIAEVHGGSIVARASDLGGLRVILRLPLSEEGTSA